MLISPLGWSLAFRSGAGVLLVALLIPPLEIAAVGDGQQRRGEHEFAERVSGGTQSALYAGRGEEGRLSLARGTGGGMGPDFSVGDGAHAWLSR
jgi:hypothetical protein